MEKAGIGAGGGGPLADYISTRFGIRNRTPHIPQVRGPAPEGKPSRLRTSSTLSAPDASIVSLRQGRSHLHTPEPLTYPSPSRAARVRCSSAWW